MDDNLNDAPLDYGALLDESLAEMESIARGERIPTKSRTVDLATRRDVIVAGPSLITAKGFVELRERLHVSQSVFADLLNVSASLVRAWERGARLPDGVALVALQMIEAHPDEFLARLTPIGGRQVAQLGVHVSIGEFIDFGLRRLLAATRKRARSRSTNVSVALYSRTTVETAKDERRRDRRWR